MDLQSATAAAEAQNQTLSPEHSTNGDGDQQVDFDLSHEAQEARKKQEDFDKITSWMDVTSDPTMNRNSHAAGEMVKFDAEGPPQAGCSKSNPMIKKKSKPLLVSTRNRDYLPRRSKTRAYESLKRLVMGIIEAPVLVDKKRRNVKRLNRKRESNKKIQKNNVSSRWHKREVKKIKRRKPRSKFTKAKVSKQNSGTSFNSTLSCSTCRSQDSYR